MNSVFRISPPAQLRVRSISVLRHSCLPRGLSARGKPVLLRHLRPLRPFSTGTPARSDPSDPTLTGGAGEEPLEVSSTSDYERVRELWRRSGRSAKVSLSAVKADGKTPRFFDRAEVKEVEEGWTFVLDGRRVISEAGNDILLPSREIAELVALEWDCQRDFIRPVSMPLMKLSSTAAEQIPHDKLEMLYSFKAILENDVVSQRSRNNPTIVRLQNKFYNPILLWMEEKFGDRLRLTEWVASRDQPFDLIMDVLDHVAMMDDWRFAIMDTLATQMSSVMLPLAVVEGKIDLQTALQASRIEVDWQMRRDGRVEGLFNHGIDLEYNRLTISAAYSLLDHLEGLPVARVAPVQQQQEQAAEKEGQTEGAKEVSEPLQADQVIKNAAGDKVVVLAVSEPTDSMAILRQSGQIHEKIGGAAISGLGEHRRFAKNAPAKGEGKAGSTPGILQHLAEEILTPGKKK